MQLEIYRGPAITATFEIDESTIFRSKLPATKLFECQVLADVALNIEKGDYIIDDGETYRINVLPEMDKDSQSLAKSYSFTFESKFYQTLNTFVLDSFGKAVFPYYASAADHLQLMVNNANRDDSGWVVGEVDATEEQIINYNWTYVRTAIDQIAEDFGLEYEVTGKTIRMVKRIGRDTGLTFELGRGKGLHQIKRSSDTSKSTVNRVYGVGGTRNITTAYRGGNEPNLIFEGRCVETPGVTAGTEPVEEGKYENEKIFPQFKGVVRSVSVIRRVDNSIKEVTITDPAIDFDINAQLALTPKDMKAKVGFLTGPLTGVELEISNYNHATKTVTLINNTDANGYELPNDLNLPEVGNKFTFYDFVMPVEYFTKAENDLKAETLEYLEDNKLQRLIYVVKPDEKYLKDNDIQLKVGDLATVIDADMEVNATLRFTEIIYPPVNPWDITAVISSDIRYDKVVKLFADVIQTKEEIKKVDRTSAQQIKRGVQNLRALEASIFDTDGLFDSEKLNVGVVSAMLGIFGTKSQNFKLSKVYITDNYNADPNAIHISAGELIHFEYDNTGQNIWQMQELTQSGLLPASLYYVYAKCSKTSQVGSFVATTEQIKVDDLPGFFHFLAGVVYPVNGTYRDADFTHGVADINGNRLKIGKIVSRTGQTGFDLDNDTIFGKILFRSSAGGLKNVEQGIQESVDNLKIGGRNIVKDGMFKSGLSGWAGNGGTATAEVIDGTTVLRIQSGALGNGVYSFERLYQTIKTNTDYTISFDIKGNLYHTLNLMVGLNDLANVVTVPNSNQWNRVSYTMNTGNGTSTAIVIFGTSGVQDFYITKLKIEEGNKATDFTEAPEDVSAEIVAVSAADKAQALLTASADAQTKANNAYSAALSAANTYAAGAANAAYAAAASEAATAYNNLTNSLKSLAYQDLETLAINGQTIISGGKINTVLLDAAAIRANIIDVAYIAGLDLNFTKGTIGGFAISRTGITGDNGQTSPNSNTGILEITSGASPSIVLKNRFVNNQGQTFTTRGVRLHGLGAEIQHLTTNGNVQFLNVQNAQIANAPINIELRWFYGVDGLNYLSFVQL